mgnify:CR=1 FL=1
MGAPHSGKLKYCCMPVCNDKALTSSTAPSHKETKNAVINKYILFFIDLQKLMVPRELADWPKVRREREASGTAEAPVVVAQIQPMSP